MRQRPLLDSAPPNIRHRLQPGQAERLAEEFLERARAEHPGLELGDPFLAFVGARLTAEVLEGSQTLHVEDLALAFGCLAALPAALEHFDLKILRPVVRQLHADADVAQRVREKLWVGGKLEEYAGRGPLTAWTRMVVRRLVLNELRAASARPTAATVAGASDDPLWALMDPEVLALQADARSAFKQALGEALAALAPEDRQLLRLHHLEAVPHGELGKRLGMPRSTVAFRLERARTRLLEKTRDSLQRFLGERPSDVNSLIRAVRGDLELSLSLLRQ